jgi:spore maturation protein CgeB
VRVAIVGEKGFDTLENNLQEAFEYLGHEAYVFNTDENMPIIFSRSRFIVYKLLHASYSFCRWVWKRLAREVLKYSPDLVIVTYRHAIPEFVELLKSSGNFPVVHLNPDHIGTLGRQYIFMSPYDAYFSKEPFLVETMLKQMGLNAFYLPECFNPRVHRKPEISKEECEKETDVDIVVIANLWPYRVRFLERVLDFLDNKVSIVIYGNPNQIPWEKTRLWKFHGGRYLVGEEKVKAFYGARIALNNLHPDEFIGVNCRFFEAIGSGGFLITEDRPVISELAVPDREVVTYKTAEEAAEKIRYYLNHNEERLAIAEAGYQRAIKDHTYEKRIETILETLNLT